MDVLQVKLKRAWAAPNNHFYRQTFGDDVREIPAELRASLPHTAEIVGEAVVDAPPVQEIEGKREALGIDGMRAAGEAEDAAQRKAEDNEAEAKRQAMLDRMAKMRAARKPAKGNTA